MKLVRAQIKNFRSIAEQQIRFEPRFRTLVGVNEAGKSNVLAALSLLDPTREPSAADVREPLPDEAYDEESYVRFIFRLDHGELEELKAEVLRKIFPHSASLMSLRGTQKYNAEALFSHYSEVLYRINIRKPAKFASRWLFKNPKLQDGWLFKKSDTTLPNPLVLSDGEEIDAAELQLIHESLIKPSERELFEPATLERVESLYDKSVYRLVRANLPSCLYWSYSDENLLPSRINFDDFRQSPEDYLPLKEMFELAGISDPASAIDEYEKRPHGRRNLLQRVGLAATAHLQMTWPECKDIRITLSPNGQYIDASIKDAHNEFAFESRSDGFKRFITFILLVASRVKNGTLKNFLFLQDEPDLGLHPSGVKHLLASLIALSESNYAVVATHSIFLVDKERVDRHIIVTKNEEVTTLSEVEASNITDEEVIYNALGHSLFDQLKSTNIVFEGWRDKRLFQVALSGKKKWQAWLKSRERAVGFCHSKGLKDLPRISTFLQLAGRQGYAVIDSDDAARSFQKKEADKYLMLQRYDELMSVDKQLTAEDFIQPGIIRDHFNGVLRDGGHGLVAPLDFFTGEGSVKVLEAWLLQNKVAAEESRRLVNEWKSRVFDNLKPEDIVADYSKVVEGIQKLVDG